MAELLDALCFTALQKLKPCSHLCVLHELYVRCIKKKILLAASFMHFYQSARYIQLNGNAPKVHVKCTSSALHTCETSLKVRQFAWSLSLYPVYTAVVTSEQGQNCPPEDPMVVLKYVDEKCYKKVAVGMGGGSGVGSSAINYSLRKGGKRQVVWQPVSETEKPKLPLLTDC